MPNRLFALYPIGHPFFQSPTFPSGDGAFCTLRTVIAANDLSFRDHFHVSREATFGAPGIRHCLGIKRGSIIFLFLPFSLSVSPSPLFCPHPFSINLPLYQCSISLPSHSLILSPFSAPHLQTYPSPLCPCPFSVCLPLPYPVNLLCCPVVKPGATPGFGAWPQWLRCLGPTLCLQRFANTAAA